MTLNQKALAKAADALMNIQGEVLTIYFARIAITTYLTELNKTHVIMPRELDLDILAKAIHIDDCEMANKQYDLLGFKRPENWADPFIPSGIRQLTILRGRAKRIRSALISEIDALAAGD